MVAQPLNKKVLGPADIDPTTIDNTTVSKVNKM